MMGSQILCTRFPGLNLELYDSYILEVQEDYKQMCLLSITSRTLYVLRA